MIALLFIENNVVVNNVTQFHFGLHLCAYIFAKTLFRNLLHRISI